MEAYTVCPTLHEYIEGMGLVQLWVSEECLQDMRLYQALLDTDRTGPISDEEIKEWQDVDALLEGFNRHDVIKKYNVQFFRDDIQDAPYEAYEEGWEPQVNYEFKK